MEFDNVKKQNRISVLFALEYLSEGINKFADDEFHNHHSRLVSMLQHLNYPPCARSCSKISKNEQSWCRTCSGWRTTILSSHKNRSSIGKKGSDWSKIDSSRWPTVATEVERCYQPDWSITMTGPNAGDISILIGKLINCSDIRSLFANTVDPDCIRVIRNKIVHNSGEISPAEKNQCCQQMLDFLRTPAVWLYQEAKDAHSKIQLFMRYDYIVMISPLKPSENQRDFGLEFRQVMTNLQEIIPEKEVEYVLSEIFKNPSIKPLGRGLKAFSKSFKYDFFVSHSHLDGSWVDKTFLRHLESKFDESDVAFRGCIADRDFTPGISVLDNILAAIGESNKVILVISESFVSSYWCQYEADQAVIKSLKSKDDSCVIPVLLEDCDIPDKIAHLNYVNLSKDTKDTDLRREFRRLKLALMLEDK